MRPKSYQFVIEEMRSAMLDDYFQLKNEWQMFPSAEGRVELHHRYSREVAEQQLIVAAPMRHLEHFTSREAYSFPHCPRIYKCSMVANYCAGNELRVDLAVLSEKLTGSLAKLPASPRRKELLKKLERQLEPLVDGFEYLWKRYGPFLVNQRLISWNSYGMLRVWLCENVLENEAENQTEGESAMVGSLVGVLQQSMELRFWERSSIFSFERLREGIERGEYDRMWESSRRVKFEQGFNTRPSQFPHSNSLLCFPKNTNRAHSNASIDSQGQSLTSGRHLPGSFQFDRSKRVRGDKNRLSSERACSRNRERSLLEEEQESQHNLRKGKIGIELKQKNEDEQLRKLEKENLQPLKRKESKTLTCLLAASAPLHTHSRRYSNGLLQEQQQLSNPLSHTQECFPIKRKSSLLRLQLESEFGGLFPSSEELSFDSSQLEKQLQGVL